MRCARRGRPRPHPETSASRSLPSQAARSGPARSGRTRRQCGRSWCRGHIARRWRVFQTGVTRLRSRTGGRTPRNRRPGRRCIGACRVRGDARRSSTRPKPSSVSRFRHRGLSLSMRNVLPMSRFGLGAARPGLLTAVPLDVFGLLPLRGGLFRSRRLDVFFADLNRGHLEVIRDLAELWLGCRGGLRLNVGGGRRLGLFGG